MEWIRKFTTITRVVASTARTLRDGVRGKKIRKESKFEKA